MATMDDMPFCREVERLVNAPYAPSLQDLYKSTKQAPSTSVSSWVSQKPCQVGPLVDVLVDGLSRSRFALPLLASFARAQEFRDSFLERYPHLLDQFLQQCTEGNSADFLSICLSLLSSPLPSGVIPPASLALFVMQMIEKMRDNACVETVRPLYLISSCLKTTGVIYELPPEVMTCFQTELTKTLRNLDDHMGNLLCLATFAKLVSSKSGSAQEDNSEDYPAWLQSIKHFFGPKRSLKTLDLVVLRVILACSSNYGNLTAEGSAESIRLAISICENVDQAQRERWIEGNSVKLAKLHEKLSRDGIDQSVKMLGVSFLVSLIPVKSLPLELTSLPFEWLVSDDASKVLEALPTQIVPRLVEAHATSSKQNATDKALQYVMSALSTTTAGITDLAKLQTSKLVLQGLRSSNLNLGNAELEPYRQAVDNMLKGFPRQTPDSNCDGDVVCGASAQNLVDSLLSDLLAFWVEATLPRGTEESTLPSGAAMVLNLLNKSAMMLPDHQCVSQLQPAKSRAALSTIRTRELGEAPRGDWRSGMRDVLMSKSQTLNDSVMQKVENVCYDLEQRCGSIEAPLRAAEEERDKYHVEAKLMKERNDDLEVAHQHASHTIANLQEEMSRLARHAESATSRVDELSETLEQTRHELEELRRTTNDTLASERESFRTRELDIIASVTQKDDYLDELQEEVKCQAEINQDLKAKLASTSQDRDASLEENTALKSGISVLQSDLEHNRASLAQKDERITQLTTENSIVDESFRELQEKLQEEVSKTESLRNALHETTERFRVELEELRRESDIQSSRMAGEAAERNSEIIALQRGMHETKSEASKELQTREKRIQELEKKVQSLRDERASKAREFSEAQQHISRLMGVMGFKPPAPSENRVSSKQRPRPPSTEQTQAATMPTQTQTQTESGGGIFQSREEDPATSAYFSTPRPTGRNPKRSRNAAFPSAQPSPPRAHQSNKKSRDSVPQGSTKKHQERRPLMETDQNSQPNSQETEDLSCSRRESFQDTQLNLQADQNRLDDIDLDLSLEFSKDFVFTSTSMSELNGHAR